MSAKNRWTLTVIIVLASLRPAAAQEVEAPLDTEVVKVEVNLVLVNVSVTDGDKHPVTGLQAADFRVSDEGRAVGVEFFDGQGPSSIVFVVDVSSSMKYRKWKKLTDGLKKFLAHAREGNDYTLIAFGDEPRLIAESVSAEELWQRVRALEPGGETALYDAMLLGLETLGRAPRMHKALVLLSDGQDNRSSARLADVQREALARRATIYAVGITDDVYTKQQASVRVGKDILSNLAAATGGLAFFPDPHDIRMVLDGVNRDLSGQYTLGYYAANEAKGWRNILVSLTPDQRRFRLRYQQRYLKR